MIKIIFFIFSVSLLFAEEFIDYTSVFYKIYTEEQYVASSYLVDEKYSKDRYSPNKVCDGRENTAWVVSTASGGVGEYICFWINIDSGNGNFFPKKLKLKIKNGLFSNKNLYYANNRLKSAKLELYECDVLYGQDKIRLRNKPILNMTMKLDFEDEMVEQQFDIIIEKPKLKIKEESQLFFYFGKLIITDVYKGSKYNDTCISEIETESFE